MIDAKEALLSSKLNRGKRLNNLILDSCLTANTSVYTDMKLTEEEQRNLTLLGFKVILHKPSGGFDIDWSSPTTKQKDKQDD